MENGHELNSIAQLPDVYSDSGCTLMLFNHALPHLQLELTSQAGLSDLGFKLAYYAAQFAGFKNGDILADKDEPDTDTKEEKAYCT